MLNILSTCVTNTGAVTDEDGFTRVTHRKKLSPKYDLNKNILRGKNMKNPLSKKGDLSDIQATDNRLFKAKTRIKFQLENIK